MIKVRIASIDSFTGELSTEDAQIENLTARAVWEYFQRNHRELIEDDSWNVDPIDLQGTSMNGTLGFLIRFYANKPKRRTVEPRDMIITGIAYRVGE